MESKTTVTAFVKRTSEYSSSTNESDDYFDRDKQQVKLDDCKNDLEVILESESEYSHAFSEHSYHSKIKIPVLIFDE
jgi:hypothetical protein